MSAPHPSLAEPREWESALQPGVRAERATGLTDYNRYLLPAVERLLGPPADRTLFEIGFGNGAVAAYLAAKGFRVAGIDASASGPALARAAYPHLDRLEQGSVYDPLDRFGRFQAVLSLEVVEHLYFPRRLAEAAFALLEPGGIFVLSTLYHGWLKNIALAAFGRFDRHFDPLWDHGHIKFFTRRTLRALLEEAGFENVAIRRHDFVPQFARSMVAVARRPLEGNPTDRRPA
jgi:2-polyprenyl-3-methyl-5-hydroxy-6-metoxy-1,4-benzoquinol methylase